MATAKTVDTGRASKAAPGKGVSGKPAKVQDALVMVMHRNEFAVDMAYRWRRVALFAISGCVVASVVAVSSFALRKDHFFASTGRDLIPIRPLSQPYVTQETLVSWAQNAVMRVNMYDFANYATAFNEARRYFTREGWEQFSLKVNESGNLRAVIENRYVVTAAISAAPTVVKEGLRLDGRFAWTIEVPTVITYLSPTARRTVNALAEVEIVQVPIEENPEGMGVQSLIINQL